MSNALCFIRPEFETHVHKHIFSAQNTKSQQQDCTENGKFSLITVAVTNLKTSDKASSNWMHPCKNNPGRIRSNRLIISC